MTKRVARGALGQPGLPDRGRYRFLQDGLMDMMASLLAGLGMFPAVLLGKHPLPPPIPGRIGILAVESLRQQDAAPPVSHILFVNGLHPSEVLLKRGLERLWKHRDPVLGSFSVSDEYLLAGEVNVLHAQPQAFYQAQSRAGSTLTSFPRKRFRSVPSVFRS